MGRVVLDTGALIGWERGSADVRAHIELARDMGHDLVVPTGVLGQYWRGGAHAQVRVARLLAGCELVSLTPELARAAGLLLGLSRTSDIIDATVAVLAADSVAVVTSDPQDIRHLLDAGRSRHSPKVLHV